jgi:hypothetical protein
MSGVVGATNGDTLRAEIVADVLADPSGPVSPGARALYQQLDAALTA